MEPNDMMVPVVLGNIELEIGSRFRSNAIFLLRSLNAQTRRYLRVRAYVGAGMYQTV